MPAKAKQFVSTLPGVLQDCARYNLKLWQGISEGLVGLFWAVHAGVWL